MDISSLKEQKQAILELKEKANAHHELMLDLVAHTRKTAVIGAVLALTVGFMAGFFAGYQSVERITVIPIDRGVEA